VHFYEVDTKIACINSSQTKILLVDSSKFDKIRPNYFARLEDMDIVITDTGISDEWKATIEAAGVKLYLA
jgi:DeoR family deoxyribose operon repressor